mmetsp:Transcript_8757/g.25080  ORF Transcript_8757/g.25080 Transcript_8757/m.25080 type:complete len:274 (-) Transcript_8757:22-843(-)
MMPPSSHTRVLGSLRFLPSRSVILRTLAMGASSKPTPDAAGGDGRYCNTAEQRAGLSLTSCLMPFDCGLGGALPLGGSSTYLPRRMEHAFLDSSPPCRCTPSSALRLASPTRSQLNTKKSFCMCPSRCASASKVSISSSSSSYATTSHRTPMSAVSCCCLSSAWRMSASMCVRVRMMTSWKPYCSTIFIGYHIIGLFAIGSSALGQVSVKVRSLWPVPPANITTWYLSCSFASSGAASVADAVDADSIAWNHFADQWMICGPDGTPCLPMSSN